jgi:VanZ family protein
MAAEGIRYFISRRAYNINDLLANLVGGGGWVCGFSRRFS